MAISYANIQVTKVLTLRGNTIQNNRYTGLPGEITVDTEAKTIRIHDGTTPGGNVIQGAGGASSYANANVKVYLTAFDGNIIPSANAVYSLGTVTNQWKSLFVSNSTIYVGGVPLSIDATGNLTVNGNTIPTVSYVNTAVANVTVDLSSYALNANVTAANVGLKGYVDQANTIQSAQISSANVGMKGYVDQQITDLIGGAPSILDTLNEIAASINDDANVYTSLTNSIATANTALKGYVDQANTIQSTAITAANLGLKGYVDSQSFYSNAKVAAYLPTYTGNIAANITKGSYTWTFGVNGSLTTPGSIFLPGGIGIEQDTGSLLTSAPNDIILSAGTNGGTDSVFIKTNQETREWEFNQDGNLVFPDASIQTTAWTGTVDYANVTNAYSNVQVGVYTNLSTYAWNANITAANVGIIGYIDQGNTIQAAAIVAANVGLKGYVDSRKNFDINGGFINFSASPAIGTDGITFNDGSFQTTAYTGYGNVQVGVYTNLSTYAYSANVTAANVGMKGYVDSQSFYSNTRVATYLQVGNIANVSVAGNVTATYFIGNGALLTGIVAGGSGTNYSNVNVQAYTESMGFKNYSNVNVAAYLNATGYNLYSNVNVASYLSTATINTTGNITAQYLTGNINITGNVVGTSPNVTIQAGGNVWVFDNTGNLTLPTNADIIGAVTFTGNVTAPYFIGNGALLTGIAASSNYSNVNVATYLPTYSGNIANIRLGVAGVLTFADGTTQITAGGGSYSNVQVATYLPTYSGNVANIRLGVSGVLTFADGTTMTSAAAGTYSNVQVATYLPTYTGSLNASNILVTSANITIANIQATNSATNPGTGALRVMGGVGVAGAVVAGQLNSTGNVVANAISAYSLNTVANVVASLVNAGNVNASGNILAQNLIGMIATASQTNITAVGVLGNLTVTGNVTSSNFVGLTPNVQIIANTSVTTFDIYGNVTFPGNNIISSLGITMPTRPAFRINGVNPGSQSTANTNLKGSAITTVYNQGNYFNATTGIFTAPISGIYEVLLNARINGSFSGAAQLVVLKNGLNSGGNIAAFWETSSNTGGATHFGVSGTINLVAGDYLSANILLGNVTFDQNDNWCVTYLG